MKGVHTHGLPREERAELTSIFREAQKKLMWLSKITNKETEVQGSGLMDPEAGEQRSRSEGHRFLMAGSVLCPLPH